MSRYQLQRQATRNPEDGLANLTDVLELVFAHDSAAMGLRLPIPATAAGPIALLNVVLIITEGFAAGTLNIGDDEAVADVDAYVDRTDLDENVVGAIAQSLGSANAKAHGQYMTSAHDIVVTIGGAPAVGEGIVLAKIARL